MIFRERALSTREQARIIRQEAINLVDKANEFSIGSRRVNRRAAYKVISRSLSQSRGLPFSIRKHKALTDLSNYISLAKHNKVIGLMADHTDLLPISHPRSTKLHAMSASALVQAKIRWYTDDPRIKDDSIKSLVASAMSAPTDSAEYKYALTRLENIPTTELPLEVLTAAVNPYAGKNSAAARRAREAVQLSDRFERWIDMFGSLKKRATDGFRTYVRRNDGTTRSHSGVVLNQNMFSPQLVDIEVGKGRVASVPIKSGEGLKAFIKDPDSVDGFSQKEAEPNNAPVIPESAIVFSDAPSIYRKEEDYRGKGTLYTDDKYNIVRYDNARDAMAALDESNKRAAELDLPAPKQMKQGEVDKETGRQFWDPEEPIFAVSRRGKKTNFLFAQNWKDVNNGIMQDEPDLDEEEGRDYTRPEPKKEGDPDDTTPLLDQADKIFDGKKREEKPAEGEAAEGSRLTVPDRAYDFNPNAPYTPEFDFDDPEFLAGVDTPDLEEALLRSVEPVSATERATGFAPVDLPDGRTEEISSEAIAAALNAQGEDAEMALARAYDAIAGNTKNQDELAASREGRKADEAAEPKDLEEKFDEVVETEPEVAPEPEVTEPEAEVEATPEEVGGMTAEDLNDIPAFKGLSDEEKQAIFDSKNYDKYIPKNEDIEVPEGMYKPGESSEQDRTDAMELASAARSVAPNSLLTEKLKEAMEGDGTAGIPGMDENGEEISVPVSAESLRDAIALRGKDANAAVKKIAKPKKKKAKEEEAPVEAPSAEEAPEAPAAEETPKKQVTYKRAGRRTLLRGGKGAPFRDKEVADFLAENGFEWSDTVERDGKTIAVKAQTKLQDDEEFKAFARELRDRFDIDLNPRDGQEPIDIDAPAPEKPAEAPPTPPIVPPKGPEGVEEPEEEPKKLSKQQQENLKNFRPGTRAVSRNRQTGQETVYVLQEDGNWRLIDEKMDSLMGRPTIVEYLPAPVQKYGGQWWDDYEFEEGGEVPSEEKPTAEETEEKPIAEEKPTSRPRPRDPWRYDSERDKWFSPDGDWVFVEDGKGGGRWTLTSDGKKKPAEDREKVPSGNPLVKPEEEKPVEITSEKKRLLKKLIDERRKVQDAIDEADMSDEVTAEEKQALRDAYDELTRRIDAIVLGEDEADKKPTPEPAPAPAPAPTPPAAPPAPMTEKELKERKVLLLKLLYAEFGPYFFDRRNKNYGQARVFADELNELSTDELRELGRVINTELGFEFFKKLGFKHQNQKKKRRFRKPKLDWKKPAFVDGRNARVRDDQRIVIQDGVIFGIDGRYIGDLPEGMSQEEFLDKYFDAALGSGVPAENVVPASPEVVDEVLKDDSIKLDIKKPVFFDVRNGELNDNQKIIVNDNKIFDWDRNFIREIPEGMSEDEFLDEYYYRALRTDRDSKTIANAISLDNRQLPAEEAPAETAVEVSNPAQKMSVKASELQPGDVIAEDHFVIVKVEREGTKPVRVDGQLQEIPAYRITGYFPGSVEQSSKLWSENYAPEIYRGATPPAKGDLPELNQPKAEDYGAQFAYPNQKKVSYKGRTLWAPKDDALAEKFLKDYEAYDLERQRRKALWEAPKVDPKNDDKSAASSPVGSNGVYTDTVPASEVKVGDIAFRRDKNGLKEFFVVTNIVSTKDGMTVLEGHYPGHKTQTKEWRSGTTIEVIRGETNLPAAGDKEPLDRPDKNLPNYKELEQARKEKIAEADKNYTPALSENAFKGLTPLAPKPQLPPFYKSAEELLALGDGPAIMQALDEKGFIVFDFETIGKNVSNSENPDAPIQVAAAKFVGGKKVAELNLFINPGEALGDYYYEQDENGNRVLKADRLRDSEGNPITDEWLATQPSVKEQLEKLIEFFGENPILVGQNNTFDINILERWAEKLGLNFSMAGAVDTKGIAQALQRIEAASISFPENPADKDTATINGDVWTFSKSRGWFKPNSLSELAKQLGVQSDAPGGFHDAAFDIDVTEKVLRKLMEKAKAGDFAAGGTSKYDKKYSEWLDSRNKRKEELSRVEAEKLLSGKSTSIDEAVKNVEEASNETVQVVNGEEEVVTPKVYVSSLYKDKITRDWIMDPENTVFIPNARIKDIRLGDFIVGKNGNFQEVIGFADDEVDPGNAIKVIRADIEDGVILEGRDSERPDGGTGFFLVGPLQGGIFRRISNIDKVSPAEIRADMPQPDPIDETPKVGEKSEPVKGEPLTDDQVQTVAQSAVDVITSGAKPEATIEEAVSGLNIDETVKEQVLEAVKQDPKTEVDSDLEAASRPITSEHLSADGHQVVKSDRIITLKGRVGTVSVLLAEHKSGKYKYGNYLKVQFDDEVERVLVPANKVRIIGKALPKVTAADILRPASKTSTKTLEDVVETIKAIQAKPTPEGVDAPENVPNPEELAKTWKDKEAERDRLSGELNFVSTTPEVVASIKALMPAKLSTQSFMPSLKTGEPMTVTFGFDKPNARELASYANLMNISSPDDVLVFKATKDFISRKDHLATIKPDGTIVWVGENQKKTSSIDLKNALDSYRSPVTGLQAMAVMPEEDEEENSIPEVPGVIGKEDIFDYERLKLNINPTSEQRSVIDAIMTGKNVVVRALAGTGKTSTLKTAAKRMLLQKPDAKILYLSFNKSVQKNANKNFPENTEARTDGSIAFWNIPQDILNKHSGEEGKKKLIRSNPDISKALGFEPTTVKMNGAEVTLNTNEIPKLIRDAITLFAISDSDNIEAKHFAGQKLDEVPPIFIEYANRMWKDISSPDGVTAVSPADRVKIWALTKPDFSKGLFGKGYKKRVPNTVFFDEAQDINPVIAKVLRDQAGNGVQIVYVGDSNQAIYEFRGAINELENAIGDYDLPLTESFRFGPKIAGIANRFLTKLKSPYKLLGKGETEGEILDFMPDPTLVITRTNGGSLTVMLELLQSGKVVGVAEETYKGMKKLLADVSWLRLAALPGGNKKKRDPHEDLASFNNWTEVEEAKRKGESFGSASYMINLLGMGRTVQEIEDILDRIEVVTDKPVPTEPFKAITVEDLKEGSSGRLGYIDFTSSAGRTFPIAVEYEVKNNRIQIKNGKDFNVILRDAGFELEKVLTGKKNKDGTDQYFNIHVKNLDNPEELIPALNKIKRRAGNYPPEKPIDTVVSTGHKVKGDESDRVRIYDDFKGPELNDAGELELPDDSELRLAYVAVTRAKKAIELGSLSWILDVTSEEDESPNLSPIEEILGMRVGKDIDPVTAEEAVKETEKTARKLDEKTEAIADAIIAAIEKGTAPWRKPWTGGGFLPTSVSTGKPYRGTNVLQLWAAATANNWTDNRWLTFNQAKKLGGNIKKGEKATYIIHWTPKFRDVEQPDGTVEKQFYWTPPKFIPVFNVEQAENLNLPPLVTRPPVPVTEAEQTVLDAYKDKPEIVYRAQDGAFYRPDQDKIYMPLREQFTKPTDLFETLVHELGHSTGHSSRLGKEGKRKELQDNYGNHRASRGEEELIAEITVAILAAELGVEIDWENLAAYNESWLKPLKNDKSMIIVAAKMAQDAVNYIMGRKEEEEEEGAEKPVGEGVGSEGQTGEQIAEEAPATPAPTPEPNVGTEGQTGEEIKVAKNRDTSITNKKYKDPETGQEWDLWDDLVVDEGERGQDNPNLENINSIFASRILEGGEYMTDRAEIDKYIADILEKYGYGKKFFALANKKVSDATLGPIKESGFLEAAVGKADNRNVPEGDPLKELEFPIVLVRSRGIKKVALLHEIAHLMDGNWKTGVGGGHSMNWYATFLALLDGEGFKKEANLLRFNYPVAEGDTGAINR